MAWEKNIICPPLAIHTDCLYMNLWPCAFLSHLEFIYRAPNISKHMKMKLSRCLYRCYKWPARCKCKENLLSSHGSECLQMRPGKKKMTQCILIPDERDFSLPSWLEFHCLKILNLNFLQRLIFGGYLTVVSFGGKEEKEVLPWQSSS